MEENEKKKASGKEVLMIIVVVVLAFGLTVAGIVYLTNFLIGGDTPQQAQQEPGAIVPQATPDNVMVFSSDNDTPAAPATPPAGSPATPPAATVDPVPPAPTAPAAPIKQTTPPAPAAPAPQVASIPPQSVPTVSATKGNYQLQLFAFRNQQKADSEAQKYIKEYPDTYIMKADLGADGIWYRVRCCSSNSQDDLKGIKAELEKKYKITPYIVRVQ